MTETSPITHLTPRGLRNFATIGWVASSTEAKIAAVEDPAFVGLDTMEQGNTISSIESCFNP